MRPDEELTQDATRIPALGDVMWPDLDRFAETLARIRDADGLQALRQCMFMIRDVYGLANAAYHAISVPGRSDALALQLLTYDSRWVRRYAQMDYIRSDPVVRMARGSVLPLDWNEIERSAPDTAEFFSDAARFNVGRRGLSVPIRGPHGERALFTVTANVSATDWAAVRLRSLRDFQTIGYHVHDRLAQMVPFGPTAPVRAPSPQERRCLEAFGRGRTPKQIAADLRLSVSAVRLYLRSAREKLSCATITQAVSHALRLSIIDM